MSWLGSFNIWNEEARDGFLFSDEFRTGLISCIFMQGLIQ